MKPFEVEVSSKYGSPMGRRDTITSGRVHLVRVRMYDHDYDKGGAYWGGSPSLPLWCAYNDDGAQYLRAHTRANAKAQLSDCTFYR